MPNIILKKASISSITHQLEKMQSESENAKNKIYSALAGLDFEVASKKNIQEQIRNMISSEEKQISYSQQCKTAFVNATNAVTESDMKYGSKSESIFEKIKNYVDEKVKSVKEFFIKNKLAKYAAITGLFVASPVCVLTALDIKLLAKLASIVSHWFTTTAHAEEDDTGKTCPPSEREKEAQENARKTSARMDVVDEAYKERLKRLGYSDEQIKDARFDAESPEQLEESYNNMINSAPVKVYEGSSKDHPANAYGDYNVVRGFDDSLVHSQFEYNTMYTDDNGNVKNGGCTSVSDSIVHALNTGEPFQNPENSWGAGGCHWTTSAIDGTNSMNSQQRLNEVYNQISNNGKAVVVRVTGHSMAAVGVRTGADPNNITAADILVCDSGPKNGGQIRTLQDFFNSNSARSMDGGNGWSLRV